ncbi:MAG: tRNA (N(6)-L-threonylcarbamoyladenosine(37)-C(2))-methylthiotransferase MtaB [Alistipes sp.]|nr:tRNA (N(6)-L-threonylcarbamoyladenosine(37)-C(2))-methylthiotransferase MtaB [Candidatus Minthomonas equi]
MEKTVAFYTLGCKLNYSETSSLEREFVSGGYSVVPPTENAGIYVINTCSVTEHSDKKCRNIIRRLQRINPDAIIAVTGCYAQLKSEEILKMEGVDLVLGAHYKGRLFAEVSALAGKTSGRSFSCAVNDIRSFFPAYSSGERTRSFLKVQDGCDYYCTYCTVPLARGHSRNIPIAQIIAQAEEIASLGIKEVVLTGVNTGDFGKTTGESFLDLLRALDEVEGIERYRISSIEPNLLTTEIIDWIASGTKFLPHFHIPLQSGCDSVLKSMHRHYDTAFFAEKIAYIRSRMEHVFFGIDVIVGFPGETDEDFQKTYYFLSEVIKPAFIHVFPYSVRNHTIAAKMDCQIPEPVKEKRVKALEELCDRLHREFVDSCTGITEKVLFESTLKGGKMFGYTGNYIRIERPYDSKLVGSIVEVTL